MALIRVDEILARQVTDRGSQESGPAALGFEGYCLIEAGFGTREIGFLLQLAASLSGQGDFLEELPVANPGAVLILSPRTIENEISVFFRTSEPQEVRHPVAVKRVSLERGNWLNAAEVENATREFEEEFGLPARYVMADLAGISPCDLHSHLDLKNKMDGVRTRQNVNIILLMPKIRMAKSPDIDPARLFFLYDWIISLSAEVKGNTELLTFRAVDRTIGQYRVEPDPVEGTWEIVEEVKVAGYGFDIAPNALTEPYQAILEVLGNAGSPLGPTEIAKKLGKHSGTIKPQVRRLEELGLVVNSNGKYACR
jgi:hypothetical protein